jgi:hypothetical protein
VIDRFRRTLTAQTGFLISLNQPVQTGNDASVQRLLGGLAIIGIVALSAVTAPALAAAGPVSSIHTATRPAAAPTPPAVDCTTTSPDTCTVPHQTDDSLTVNFTVTLFNTACTQGQSSGCVYTVAVNVADNGYGTLPTYSTVCPWGTSKFAHMDSPPIAPGTTTVSCTTTFSWNPADSTPTDFSGNVLEGDGEGVHLTNYAHSYDIPYPVPPIEASFLATPVPDQPRAYTLVDTTKLPPGVEYSSQVWSVEDGGTTVYGFGSAGNDNSWTHTFTADGTYDVAFTVIDSAEQDVQAEQDVDVITIAAGPSLTVIESLKPKTDAARYDLKVAGKTIKAGAADGSYGSTGVKPGTYAVSQTISKGALTDFGVTLACASGGKSLGTVDATSADLTVKGASQVICLFTDIDTHSPHCDVPNVIGKSEPAAKAALVKAHCSLGKVTKPKKNKKAKHPKKLVVAKASPAEFAVRAAKAKVALTLKYKA